MTEVRNGITTFAMGLVLLLGALLGRSTAGGWQGGLLGLILALVTFGAGAVCMFLHACHVGRVRWAAEMEAREAALKDLEKTKRDIEARKKKLQVDVIADVVQSVATMVACKVVEECMPGLPNAEHRDAAMETAKKIVDKEVESFRDGYPSKV